MTHKLRWSVLAGLMALLSATAAACGSDNEDPTAQPTRCDGVVCDANETCNAATGYCECGDAGVCAEGQRCELEPSATCVSDLCDFTVCDRGQSCDPADGLCKCGSSECAADEVCVDGACEQSSRCDGVQCGAGESCDLTDGICKCGKGENATLCSFGQTCEDDTCKADACAGVNCGAGTQCNPNDGLCHCGSVDGAICSRGQACVDDGTGVLACNGPDICAGNTCTGGTVCDPTGLTEQGLVACRCGGISSSSPICGPGQTCDAATGRCLGGDQCANVRCTGGTSCDPEDGICKCGGLNGQVCGEGEVCANLGDKAACSPSCNPVTQTGCPDGYGCYYDASQRLIGPFCAPTTTTAPGENSPCGSATDCGAGFHCTAAADANRCREYCDPALLGADCSGTGRACVQIEPGIGICGTVN